MYYLQRCINIIHNKSHIHTFPHTLYLNLKIQCLPPVVSLYVLKFLPDSLLTSQYLLKKGYKTSDIRDSSVNKDGVVVWSHPKSNQQVLLEHDYQNFKEITTIMNIKCILYTKIKVMV